MDAKHSANHRPPGGIQEEIGLFLNLRKFLLNSASAQGAFVIDFVLRIVVLRAMLDQLGLELVGTWGTLKTVTVLPLFVQDAIGSALFIRTARSRDATVNSSVTVSLCVSVLLSIV